MAGVLLRPVWPVARREGRRHHPRPWGSDRRATKPQAKLAQPNGRQSFSLQASLLAPHRSTAGYARRSRLAWSEKPLPQNTSHLGDKTLAVAVGWRKGECVGQMPDLLDRAVAEQHFHNVETHFHRWLFQSLEVIERGLRQEPAFVGVHGGGRAGRVF